MFGASLTQSIGTVFGISLSSMVIVFCQMHIMLNSSVVRDWSFLYSLFAMALAVVSNVPRGGDLSMNI